MTKKFDEFVKALEELCRAHKVSFGASDYDSLQVWDLEDEGEIFYSGPPEDRTKYEWIDVEMEKPNTQSYVEVCNELVLFSVAEARWVPANTVVVERTEKNIVYSVLNYQPEGWYDLDGKPLTHKVTHWRYKNGRGKNEK
jgi:hypothetical protein